MTGFSLAWAIAGATDKSVSAQVSGFCYAADYGLPTPPMMTTAIGDMETAYTDAAGRSVSSAAHLNVMGGLIGGATFTPGVYMWGSNVIFSRNIYIKGNRDDAFIFKSSGNVFAHSGVKVLLVADGTGKGAPLASNIIWQVAGRVEAGTTSHLEGVFLVKTTVRRSPPS